MSELSIFEKIIQREIPAEIVLETDDVMVFKDVAPQAPVHLLAVPKKRFDRIALVPDEEEALLGKLLIAIKQSASDAGIDTTGYRIVINNGPDGGETVPHLHIHLLGGRKLQWPPG